MLTVLAALALAQAPFTVLPAGAPWRAPAPEEAVRVVGAPVVVWDGTNWVVAFSDARRGFDAADAGLDLWVGRWSGLSADPFRAVLVTTEPGPLSEFHLATGPVPDGSRRIVAVRRVVEPAGAVLVANTWAAVPTTPWEVAEHQLTLPTPISTSALAVSGTTWLVATRPAPGSLNTVTFEPDSPALSPIGLFPPFPGASLALAGLDGGFLVASVTDAGVALAQLSLSGTLTMVSGPTLTNGASSSVLVELPGDVALLARDRGLSPFITAWWRNGPGFSGPGQLVGPNLSSTPFAGSAVGSILVAGWPTTSTTSYRPMRPDGGGMLSAAFSSGAPTSMASDGTRVVATEVRSSSLTLRRLDLIQSGTGDTSIANGALVTVQTRAPQRQPSVIWDDARREFLVVWDQRQSDGGWRPVQAPFGSLSNPTPVSNTVGSPGDSDLALARRVDGGLEVLVRGTAAPYVARFDPQLGLQGATKVVVAAESIVGGAENVLTWSTKASQQYEVPGFAPQTGSSTPTCIAFFEGSFWSLTSSPRPQTGFQYSLSSISEATGLVGASRSFLGARMRGARICLAFSDAVTLDGGPAFVGAEAVGGEAVLTRFPAVGVGSTSPFGSPISDVATDPLMTPLGPGFLVAYRGTDERLHADYAGPLGASDDIKLQGLLQGGPTGASALSLASSADRSQAALAWHEFDPDAGAWVIGARVFAYDAGPRASVDAGVDGGSDAGTDAGGAFDAGLDAGADPDAGLDVDAGDTGEDAGLDASVPVMPGDAGLPDLVFVANGCGCSTPDASAWLGAAVVALFARRRPGARGRG
ncbi:MAG: MYXO-CTERM sorting domain-containing protein [Myxococcaceae bacterium]|nr:MYXO-CTERM sorting domain-containing protein [Myxococcaceae bacterium]